MTLRAPLLTGITFALVMSGASLALAQETSRDSTLAKQVGDALMATMSKVSGDSFSYKEAIYDEAGDTVILSEVSLVRKGAKRPAIVITTTQILSPEMTDEGGFTAEQVAVQDIKLQSRSTPGSVASASADKVAVKSAALVSEGAISQWFSYETSSVTDVRLGGVEDAPIQIAKLDTIADINADGIPLAGTVTLDGLVIDVEGLPRHPAKQQLTDLGYEQLTFDLDATGRYDIDTETLHVDSFILDGTDAAKLSVEATIGGIPARFMASPLDVRTIIATASIGGLKLSVADQSVTNRVLTAQAEKSGTTREALAAQLTGGLGFFLTALQNEAFQKQASEAIGTFLQEPDMLTVTMAPENPVPFLQVFAAATSAPGTIVDLLGLAISNAP